MTPPKKKITNLRIKQQALYVMIFSFVTIVIWISASLFRSQRRTGISPDLLELAKPLSPTINVEIIDEIEESINYSDQELVQFQIYKLIKSKDGRTQQIVPIDNELNEIPEQETRTVVIEEIPEQSLLEIEDETAEQTNFDGQENGEEVIQEEEQVITPPRGTEGFGSDGRYYLD